MNKLNVCKAIAQFSKTHNIWRIEEAIVYLTINNAIFFRTRYAI